MSEIKLVCLDFDGTIMCYEEDPPTFHEEVIETLNRLAGQGIGWCTNSGRNHVDQQDIIQRAAQKGLRHWPSALLCSESLIFPQRGEGYEPQEAWNTQIHQHVRAIQEQVRQRLDPYIEELAERHQPESHFSAHYTAFHVLGEGSHPALFYDELCRLLSGMDDILITRNGPWINILPRESGKGNTLREYARLAGVDLKAILAIGDHLNDLNMLDGASARHVGCPADAVPEIIAAVASAGGQVASEAGPYGTIEVIQRYCFKAG